MARFYLLVSLLFILLAAGTPNDGKPPFETAPGLTMPGTVKDCNKWYTIKSGDTCEKVYQYFGITEDDFYHWNPDVSKDCLVNFWSGYSYCVGIGEKTTTTSTSVTSTVTPPSSDSSTTSITTSNFDSSTNPITTSSTASSTTAITSSSVVTTEPTTISSSVPGTTNATYSIINPITSYNLTTSSIDTAWPPTHTQPGQPSTCNKWHLVRPGDTCDVISGRYAAWATFEDLVKWNPSLADDCTNPFVGWWICVGTRPETSLSFEYPTGNPSIPDPTVFIPEPTSTITSEITASPTQSGLASDCKGFYLATKGDTCSRILSEYNFITEKELHEWNPALKDDCSGLFADYYYCVAAFPTGTGPMPPTVTTTPSPTQSGLTTNCKAWYRATEGDTCEFIVAMFGTFSDKEFLAWNPSIWDDCTGLKDDYWYCVADLKTPPTRTGPLPNVIPTENPHQPGVVGSCIKWWIVSRDDTCETISEKAGITLDQFYSMNPDVNAAGECSKLFPDYEVCVGVPFSPDPPSPTGWSSLPVSSSVAVTPTPGTPLA